MHETDAGSDAGIGDAGAQEDGVVTPDSSFDPDAPVVDDSRMPVLSNFRVDVTDPSRVLFDSSERIRASDVTGFEVSNATVVEIHIQSDRLDGHALSLAEPLTYWDNNTLRYRGGGDISDLHGNALPSFTLSYVENDLPEPEAPNDRYVAPSASGGGDGLTESTAWTLEESFTRAEAGMTVWLKAGNYGEQYVTMDERTGTPTSPIKFIGYRSVIGDITDNYWDYGVSFDASQMPTLTGTKSAGSQYGRPVYFGTSHYVIVRNFQFTNYTHGIDSFPRAPSYNSNIVLDRINGYDSDQSMINIYTSNDEARPFPAGNNNFRITNSVFMKYEMAAISLNGEGRALIENVKVYNDDPAIKPDYQIGVSGDDNIIRNCHVEMFFSDRSTHGIGVRGGVRQGSARNLIERSVAVNINEGFYLRNLNVNDNVIKDVVARHNEPSRFPEFDGVYRGGVYIWGGANDNVIERIQVDNAFCAICFKDNWGEDDSDDSSIGRGNVIRNSTFTNVFEAISVTQNSPQPARGAVHDTLVQNCSFHNVVNLFRLYYADIQNFRFVNTTFSNVLNQNVHGPDATGGYAVPNYDNFDFDHVNLFEFAFDIPRGPTTLDVDPGFVDADTGDFHLTESSPLLGAGVWTEHAQYDMEREERSHTAPSIGAYE